MKRDRSIGSHAVILKGLQKSIKELPFVVSKEGSISIIPFIIPVPRGLPGYEFFQYPGSYRLDPRP